jgi:hypothetical protein
MTVEKCTYKAVNTDVLVLTVNVMVTVTVISFVARRHHDHASCHHDQETITTVKKLRHNDDTSLA